MVQATRSWCVGSPDRRLDCSADRIQDPDRMRRWALVGNAAPALGLRRRRAARPKGRPALPGGKPERPCQQETPGNDTVTPYLPVSTSELPLYYYYFLPIS